MMRTKYEVDMNELNSFELGEIKDLIDCARTGKKVVPVHTKGKHYLRSNDGEIRACDFLGCAFIGKYGLEPALYNHDPFSWQILLYQEPLSAQQKPNSFGDYIRILSDRSGFDAVIDYLSEILLEYEEREKEAKTAYEGLLLVKNTFFKKEELETHYRSYLNEEAINELIKHYWNVIEKRIEDE